MEILYRGAIQGEPGIMLSLEESPEMIRQNAATMGRDFQGFEAQGKLFLMEGKINHGTIMEGQFGLDPLLSIIAGKARELGARRLVLDAPDVLLNMMQDGHWVRAELVSLTRWLSSCGLTTIMTVKPRKAGQAVLFQDFFDSLAHCVISLSARVVDQITTRRLRVINYPGL